MSIPIVADAKPAAQLSHTPLLRMILRVDAVFTLITSIALIAESAQLAAETGIPAPALLTAGIACLAYAAYLWWAIQKLPLRQVGWINLTIGYIWVAASILAIVSGILPLTSFGFWLIVGLAVAVDLLASAQAYALVKRK